MALYAGVTQWQVRRFWRAAEVKPHRLKTFKLSRNPQIAETVIDVDGVYLNRPDNAQVLSVGEMTQIPALERTYPGRQRDPVSTRMILVFLRTVG